MIVLICGSSIHKDSDENIQKYKKNLPIVVRFLTNPLTEQSSGPFLMKFLQKKLSYLVFLNSHFY